MGSQSILGLEIHLFGPDLDFHRAAFIEDGQMDALVAVIFGYGDVVFYPAGQDRIILKHEDHGPVAIIFRIDDDAQSDRVQHL